MGMTAVMTLRDAPATTDERMLDDVRHPLVCRVADVLRSRSRAPRTFLIDDRDNIEQAVACGIELDSLYATGSAAPELAALAEGQPHVPFHVIDDPVAVRLFGEQKRSRVFALARAPRPSRLRDLRGAAGDVVVLDGVRLVGNMGAIARTACALDASGVVLLDSGLRSALDRRLIRASRGLVFATPVVLADRAEFVDFVRREELPVAALAADAAQPVEAIRGVTDRLVIALGGERTGISPEVDALTTHRYSIPMAPHVESLNVSVAAGIALHEHRAGVVDVPNRSQRVAVARSSSSSSSQFVPRPFRKNV